MPGSILRLMVKTVNQSQVNKGPRGERLVKMLVKSEMSCGAIRQPLLRASANISRRSELKSEQVGVFSSSKFGLVCIAAEAQKDCTDPRAEKNRLVRMPREYALSSLDFFARV